MKTNFSIRVSIPMLASILAPTGCGWPQCVLAAGGGDPMSTAYIEPMHDGLSNDLPVVGLAPAHWTTAPDHLDMSSSWPSIPRLGMTGQARSVEPSEVGATSCETGAASSQIPRDKSGRWGARCVSQDSHDDGRVFILGWLILNVMGLCAVGFRRCALQKEIRVQERVRERVRIARELHDSLLQVFHAQMLRLQEIRGLLPGRCGDAIRPLEDALLLGGSAIVDVRDAISGMRAATEAPADLVEALVDMGRGLSVEQNSAALSFHESGLRRKLDSVAHEEVCRVIRESVLNAYRHASASRVEVRILYEPSRLCIHVCDDGVGLPANQSTAQSEGHWGMQGMRERACELGARLRWRSEPGKGTEVELNVPARVAYRLAVGQRKPWPIMSRLRVRHA